MANNLYDQEYFEQNTVSKYGDCGGYQDFPLFKELAKLIVYYFSPKKVADIGCAKGYVVKHLNCFNVECFGSDISVYAINSAELEVREKLFIENIDNLHYADSEFELVTCFETLEHIPEAELDKTIDELARISNKYLFLTIAHEYNKEDKTHVSLFPREWWINKFASRGLDIDWSLMLPIMFNEVVKQMNWNVFVFRKK